MAKSKVYWSLLVKYQGVWSVQFGDYDKTVVRDERFDNYADDDCMIVGTSDKQADIEKYVYNLNNGIPNE